MKKKLDKFYAGIDVIYKPSGKNVCNCLPVLCPAKVYYSLGDDKGLQCDVIVGILYDSHNIAYPITAIYDAFNQFKNLVKGRNAIHTVFGRLLPSSIEHDFTAEELNTFSQELFPFLKIKSALQEMEGRYIL